MNERDQLEDIDVDGRILKCKGKDEVFPLQA
jgi:hypothetical protein